MAGDNLRAWFSLADSKQLLNELEAVGLRCIRHPASPAVSFNGRGYAGAGDAAAAASGAGAGGDGVVGGAEGGGAVAEKEGVGVVTGVTHHDSSHHESSRLPSDALEDHSIVLTGA